MSHRVPFELPTRDLGKADIHVLVKRDGVVLGKLEISRGSLVWYPKNHSIGHKVGWAKFDEIARQVSVRERRKRRLSSAAGRRPRFRALSHVGPTPSRSSSQRTPPEAPMEFLLLFTRPPASPPPAKEALAEMGAYARELADRKILKRGAPLAREGASAVVRVRNGRPLVLDGPFAETKEVIAGFWVIDVADREAAIEVARGCPHAKRASVLVARLAFRGAFEDAAVKTPYLMVFWMERGLDDRDGAKGREMRAFGESLAAGTLFETGRLADAEPPARIEPRGGKALVLDGPFAETKEVIGGYALVRAASRADAIALAERFPHARWGTVEVREVPFFDRV